MQRCDTEILSAGIGLATGSRIPSLHADKLGLKRGPRWIFQDINFEAKPGEVLVLSGCSGAGKSTLLSILFGELQPSSGTLKTQNLSKAGQVGIVYQDLCLSEELPVSENILSGQLFRLRWWNFFLGFQNVQKERAWQLACDFELQDLWNKPVKLLSGGERQRVAVAKLLFQDPALILVDEPVSALDPRLAQKVLHRLKWEAKENSKIVICALHQRDLILDFADRIIEFC